MKHVCLALCVVLALATGAWAEEFIMKDGTRITGRIVAYKSDSFIVQTSFGQAIVYKSKVAKINFGEGERPGPTPSTEKSTPPAAAPSSRAAAPSGAGGSAVSELPPAEAPAWQQKLAERVRTSAPAPIVDRIEGTSYINETFHFRMYKPPSWRIFPGATRGLGPAIVVMGTEDETTLLMVGHENFNGSLESYAAASERQMARGYGNYRKTAETRTVVNGLPALRRTFTGDIDGTDWYGHVTYFTRGQEQFAIVGLTTGELHDFTEGLFRKVVNTFEFFRP